MRDYQKEWNEYKVRCIICHGAWIPGTRHVVEDRVEDCRPDNLTYIEWLYDQQTRK